MSPSDRELLVCRIMAGRERLRLHSGTYYIRPPCPKDRYEAALAAREAADAAALAGLLTEDEAVELRVKRVLWTAQDDDDLKVAERDIENLKVGLYEQVFNKRALAAGREALARVRALRAQLLERKFADAHRTVEAAAAAARTRCLVGRCLERADGSSVWTGDEFMKDTSPLLDDAVGVYVRLRLTEGEIRELARTEPWRGVWACRHSEGNVFGAPAVSLTDEQRLLTVWTRLYDNAYEDPECPPDAVIEDDDVFDGWMISRRRSREKEMKTKRTEAALGNPKIAGAGEVFVMGAQPGEASGFLDADEIADVQALNAGHAAGVLKERQAAIAAKGHVADCFLPDVQRDLQMRVNAMGAA